MEQLAEQNFRTLSAEIEQRLDWIRKHEKAAP